MKIFFIFKIILDENNETPVLTGHTTPGVVSSIVSSEALQADLQGDLRALQNQEEILPVQGERSPQQEVEYYGNEGGLQTHEEHEDIEITHEDNNANEMLDPYWTSQTGNEPITVSSQDSSQEGIYEVRYDAEDYASGNDPEVGNEPEVISDSDTGEENEYPIDRFIPIQDDSDDTEGHEDHPSVEIAEPEGLHVYQDDYEDEYENDDGAEDDEDEYPDHPSTWHSGQNRTAPPPRRISSSSDEVICLDSD